MKRIGTVALSFAGPRAPQDCHARYCLEVNMFINNSKLEDARLLSSPPSFTFKNSRSRIAAAAAAGVAAKGCGETLFPRRSPDIFCLEQAVI